MIEAILSLTIKFRFQFGFKIEIFHLHPMIEINDVTRCFDASGHNRCFITSAITVTAETLIVCYATNAARKIKGTTVCEIDISDVENVSGRITVLARIMMNFEITSD